MMPMRIRRKTRPIEKLENPTALQCGGRSFPCDHPTQFTLASARKCVARRDRVREAAVAFWALKLSHRYGRACPGHLCAAHARRTWMPGDRPGHDDVLVSWPSKAPKLLRGHGLSDMWDLPGKVAENCGKTRLDALQTRKLLRDRTEVSCGATALVLGWFIPTIGVVKPKGSRRLSGDDDVLPCRCARPCEAVRDHRGHG